MKINPVPINLVGKIEYLFPEFKVKEVEYSDDGGYYHYLTVYRPKFIFCKDILFTLDLDEYTLQISEKNHFHYLDRFKEIDSLLKNRHNELDIYLH